ncbi:hypothetical protein DDB_G0291480 [Dictyostelium discoideum AX4]|uniref:Putative uncharacterized transmembrane protein DDB_G0291480 n=1 Tax=Dictyostelium discoideum TaxID=44689 RepID=Y3923_DICDI|nr:hypothetical protein DDB_G0291480 [Dictyostelium discoideum AX4]Q54EJ6.1 RecName: Full=Putative uncharacterized transmembrane protein DDB_G0291480 [Dictyostelium discoideum]EAL61724.1 hypothetical protein DDB_G0291480 [Dictyostelium discoideum AX4]|eukprot:XP_635244.1 hypothetical protein DDB_G0291480 [Dictyostelium discoideum AX4]
MRSDAIKRRLYSKAIFIIPFWILSIALWFSSGSVYKIDSCMIDNNKTTCIPYTISKYTDFNSNSQLNQFNSSFILFQIIPINILCFLPLLGYMYILASVLKVDLVKKAFTIFGIMMLITIPLFLIVSICIFPLNLRETLCSDLKNGFIKSNIVDKGNTTICNLKESFNYFKGSFSDTTTTTTTTTTLEWGITYNWYFIIATIVFSFSMLVIVLVLLIKDANTLNNGDGQNYSLFEQENDENFEDDDPNDVIESGLDLWGRNIWYNYTKKPMNSILLSIFQLFYIGSYFSLYYFGFKFNLIPFFINLIILFISYYNLIFDGIRDNYLIKRMYRERSNDVNQFIERVKKIKPKVAIVKKPNKEGGKSSSGGGGGGGGGIDDGIEAILEPRLLKSWLDQSELDYLMINDDDDKYKPIVELTIIEDFKTTSQLPIDAISLLFVKTDLSNYYIITNKKKRFIQINRGLHSFLVLIGLSGLFNILYLKRLILKKSITIKTLFEYNNR